MTDVYVFNINKMLKRVDPTKTLRAKRSKDDVVRVVQRFGNKENLVFSLTEGFRGNGKPVIWGLEPIYQKLLQISFDQRDRVFEEMEKENARRADARDRARDNKFEDLARETQGILKKTMGDVLTHQFDRSKDPRRKYERKKKWL